MQTPLSAWIASFAERALLLGFGWWATTEGAGGWGFAVPVIIAVAVASLVLDRRARRRVRLFPALRLAIWFLRRSLLAGFDVAMRALRPRPNLAPCFTTLRLRVGSPAARVLLADAMSLVPGTLTASLDGAEITLHVLDREMRVEEELRTLERYIADVLGEMI